jgi:hypothetical protein
MGKRRAPNPKGMAAQVSKQMGVTPSDAVVPALQDRIRKTGRTIDRARVDALCARIGRLPVLDPRTAEEIPGYDAFGIPR